MSETVAQPVQALVQAAGDAAVCADQPGGGLEPSEIDPSRVTAPVVYKTPEKLSTEEHGQPLSAQRQRTAHSAATAASSSTPSSATRPQQKPTATKQSTAAAPGRQQLQPATEFSPFTAVIGSGAALSANVTLNTTADSATSAPAAPSMQPPAAASPAVAAGGSSVQVNSSKASSPHAVVPAEQLEHMHVCLAMISSHPDTAGSCMQVLSKLLGNLVAAPQEAKYRHIRLGNAKIYNTVVQVSGALDFLAAVGFEVHTAEQAHTTGNTSSSTAAAAEQDDGFAVFLDDSYLAYAQEGLTQLQQALPAALEMQQKLVQQQAQQAPQQTPTNTVPPAAVSTSTPGTAGSSSASPAATSTAAAVVPPGPVPAVQRSTQVLLPAVPDTAVPDWFFERTGAEVKAEYMAMLKQRQTGQLFASKAWKDAKLGKQGGGPRPIEATVRVRFPEGVCLQGNFHVSEPMTALFAWVTDALRDPTTTYELVAPDRKPVQLSGSIADAKLAPAVLLNFRPLDSKGPLVDDRGVVQSFLADALLQQAQAD